MDRQEDEDTILHQDAVEDVIEDVIERESEILHHTVDIAFNTPNLNNGVAFFDILPGDVITDIWVEGTQAWNGTTPKLDVGTFVGVDGWIGYWANFLVISLTAGPTISENFEGMIMPTRSFARMEDNAAGVGPVLPIIASEEASVKVVVNQTGVKGGTATGGTTGSATIHALVTRTQ